MSSLPAGAHLADSRGLTALGAILLAAVLGAIGAAIDVNTGKGLRLVFDVCFVLGCALAVLRVHREDLRISLSMPPLLYCVLALFAGAVGNRTAALSLKGQALEVLTALITGAPVLFVATGVAVVLAVARGLTGRPRRV